MPKPSKSTGTGANQSTDQSANDLTSQNGHGRRDLPPPPPKTGANSTAPPSGLPGRPHRSSDQGGTGVVTTDQGSNTADNSVSSFDGTGEGQGAGEQNSNASNTADRGRPPRTNADHPQGYSDNYGTAYHGSELGFAAKSSVVVAAEKCFGANVDEEVQTMLSLPPKRLIEVREIRKDTFNAEKIVSPLPWCWMALITPVPPFRAAGRH